MSKKKATMTLKDFHGGSIPSDLPLPSAPGVTVKPAERTSFDRPTAWGNPVGRLDQRLRPGSAGTARNFDDRTPFLSQNTNIGRNFDEDERKPLDGPSGPRRTASDESLHALPTHPVEPKIDVSAYARVSSRPSSTPGSQYSTSTVGGSYMGRFADMSSMRVSPHGGGASSRGGNVGGSVGTHMGPGPQPNAWGLRKEAAAGIREAAPPAWSAPEAAMKLAHASALEKVSSGRWHSKQQNTSQMDVATIRQPDIGADFHYRDNDILYNKSDYAARNIVGGVDYHSTALSRQVGKSLTLDDDVHLRSKEVPVLERSRTPVSMEAYERNNVHDIGKLGGAELQSIAQSKLTERPKLKLLPRSKPLEDPEAQMENSPVYQQPTAPAPLHGMNQSQSRGLPNLSKVVSFGTDSGAPTVERPRLNLKPRSESVEVDSSEIKRQTVFGGARPRELVLKDRGIDNVSVNSDELVQSPHRVKQDVVKSDRVPLNTNSPRYTEKHDNAPIENRTGKNSERRDLRLEGEKNWRVENWRNKRESDKQPRQPLQQEQQVQERPPSPETWRKPIEQAKLAPSEGQGVRFGKAASAVELAQAFSKSISDTATVVPGQRGPPGRGQVPFSRLTGPCPRPQINGY